MNESNNCFNTDSKMYNSNIFFVQNDKQIYNRGKSMGAMILELGNLNADKFIFHLNLHHHINILGLLIM